MKNFTNEKICDFCPDNCEFRELKVDIIKEHSVSIGSSIRFYDREDKIICANEEICKMWNTSIFANPY